MSNSVYVYKPESALKRADELKRVGDPQAALQVLHSVLNNRRGGGGMGGSGGRWSLGLEQVMEAYVDLAVETQSHRLLKDALHQYRNLAQSTAPGSLEKVLRQLLIQAESTLKDQKIPTSQTAASSPTLTEEDPSLASMDVWVGTTKSPSSGAALSRKNRESLKFLWETYRTILDMLRSNSKLERVYHYCAQSALGFCLHYERRSEFRHLCDLLRTHLGHLRQSTGADDRKTRGWDGWTAFSIELQLQTRFRQLDVAGQLQRYAEGFRTCEDIFHILQTSNQRRKLDPTWGPPPKAKLMASYYQQLQHLFWVSENVLFHALAHYKCYSLHAEFNKTWDAAAKAQQASAVLIAALVIPTSKSVVAVSSRQKQQQQQQVQPGAIGATVQDGIQQQRMARMATLLGFYTKSPTRSSLLQECKTKGLFALSPAYIQDFYRLLEESVNPLELVPQAQPLLEQLAKDDALKEYVPAMRKAILHKQLQLLQLSYHSLSLDHLKSLTDGLGLTYTQIEQELVTMTSSSSVRIDHRNKCLRFSANKDATAARELTRLAQSLETVCRLLPGATSNDNRLESRKQVYAQARSQLADEHAAAIERKALIENRKEQLERAQQEKSKKAAEKKRAEDLQRQADQARRLEREQRARELDRQRKIQEELDNQAKKRLLHAMGRKTEELTTEELAALDAEALEKEHRTRQLKEKEEAELKTRTAAKKLDYLVRAVRLESLPRIQERYQKRIQDDRERHEKMAAERLEEARAQWESDKETKMDLAVAYPHMKGFCDVVVLGRETEHSELCEKARQDAELQAERGKLLRARRRRDEEADAKRREAEEEARREREEEEAEKRRISDERRAAEEEEQRRKDQESAAPSNSSNSGPRKYVPPGAGAGGGTGRFGGAGGDGGSRFGDRGGGSRFGDRGGGSYVGGGRYEGRSSDDRGGGGDGGGGNSDNGRWR